MEVKIEMYKIDRRAFLKLTKLIPLSLAPSVCISKINASAVPNLCKKGIFIPSTENKNLDKIQLDCNFQICDALIMKKDRLTCK